jgi:hypothetical protein
MEFYPDRRAAKIGFVLRAFAGILLGYHFMTLVN